jgi:molecular chaperone Hsp33
MLLTRIFNDQPFSILQEHPVTFSCNCTRDRVSRALMLLGPEELKDMAAVDHGARINCDFCSEVYEFSADDLIKIHGAG